MPLAGDDAEKRRARIDKILEELRLNTEDLQELAKQALERNRKAREQTRAMRELAEKHHAARQNRPRR